MKKSLIVLGSIFLPLIVLAVIGIVFVAIRGSALDKESKAYADSTIPAIISTWSEKELLDRASPEFKKGVSIDQLDRAFRYYSSLGSLMKCEPAQGQAIISATSQTGRMTTGQYAAKATFECKRDATIKLAIIKHGKQWQIWGFHVDPHRSAPNWEVEQDAQPSDTHPYGGFWKEHPHDEFGLAIGPAGADSYYVSFCGPGGCFGKGEYREITRLVGDPAYRILDSNNIKVNSKDGFSAFHRSAGRRDDLAPQR